MLFLAEEQFCQRLPPGDAVPHRVRRLAPLGRPAAPRFGQQLLAFLLATLRLLQLLAEHFDPLLAFGDGDSSLRHGGLQFSVSPLELREPLLAAPRS